MPTPAWLRRSRRTCRERRGSAAALTTPPTSWPPAPRACGRPSRRCSRSVDDQPTAEAVNSQFDRLLEYTEHRLPEVADHLGDTREDLLAFTAFRRRRVATDLVQQPHRTAQPRDPPPHRRRRDLPQ